MIIAAAMTHHQNMVTVRIALPQIPPHKATRPAPIDATLSVPLDNPFHDHCPALGQTSSRRTMPQEDGADDDGGGGEEEEGCGGGVLEKVSGVKRESSGRPPEGRSLFIVLEVAACSVLCGDALRAWLCDDAEPVTIVASRLSHV